MAKWIRCLTTDQKIPGSSPGEVVFSAKLYRDLEKHFTELYFNNARSA